MSSDVKEVILGLLNSPIPSLVAFAGFCALGLGTFLLILSFIEGIKVRIPPEYRDEARRYGSFFLILGFCLVLLVWWITELGGSIRAVAEDGVASRPEVEVLEIKQEDVERVFENYIYYWNNENFEGMDSLLSKSFESTSSERGASESYSRSGYEDFITNQEAYLSNGLVDVDVENSKYTALDKVWVVEYDQDYARYSKDTRCLIYGSSGTNRLFFRYEDGSVKIYKEEFYRDNAESGC